MRRSRLPVSSLLLAGIIASAAGPAGAGSGPRPLSLGDLQAFGIRSANPDQPQRPLPTATEPTVEAAEATAPVIDVAPRPIVDAAAPTAQDEEVLPGIIIRARSAPPAALPAAMVPAARPPLAERGPASLSTDALQAIALKPIAAIRVEPAAVAPAAVEPAPAVSDVESRPVATVIVAPTAPPAPPTEAAAAAVEPVTPPATRPIQLDTDGLVAVGLRRGAGVAPERATPAR